MTKRLLQRITKTTTGLALTATLLPIGWFALMATSIMVESPLATSDSWISSESAVYTLFIAARSAPVLIVFGLVSLYFLRFKFQDRNIGIYFYSNLICAATWLLLFLVSRYIPD